MSFGAYFRPIVSKTGEAYTKGWPLPLMRLSSSKNIKQKQTKNYEGIWLIFLFPFSKYVASEFSLHLRMIHPYKKRGLWCTISESI
jgi:hypothetical protein